MPNEIAYSVLILDDEEKIVEILVRLLKKRGFITWATTSPEAALNFVRSHRPSVALIDLEMPNMNGIQVIRAMREIMPGIRVVVVTAYLSKYQSDIKTLNIRVVEKGTDTTPKLEAALCEELELSRHQFDAIKSREKTGARLKARILIVEEEKDIADFLKEIAQEEGFEAEAVNSAKEALEKLSTFKPDVLFTDYRMPGINGDELVKQLKASPDYACIKYYVGMTGEEANNPKFFSVGVNEVLNKPFDVTEFISAMRQGVELAGK